ncbi:thiamine-phosphate kinase [Dermabacteraceae bacterium TAE3-ERU5]|nr:thiamine-phosphate kinase [Dermabacteraceae bacterium TAE3-ERU5]
MTEWSEEKLIADFTPLLPSVSALVGPGDDAAVLEFSGGLTATIDTLTEGSDFLADAITPHQLGCKAAVQNLADVAAMGARPLALLVSLTLPREMSGEESAAFLRGVASGLRDRCAPYGVGVVGGDLGRGGEISLTVTALGRAEQPPVTRAGARAGDALVLSRARLGRSAAGLAALLAGYRPAGDCPAPLADVIAYHHAPNPPLEAGWLSRGMHALIDVSDGLVRDAGRIARASSVRLDICVRSLAADIAALQPQAQLLGADAHEWVCYGGEEHLLLGACPENQIPVGFRRIGSVSAGSGVFLDGKRVSGGFDHFVSA